MTRVISVNFGLAGITSTVVGYGVTSNPYASSYSNYLNDLIRGVQEWEKYADLIFVKVADNSFPDAAGVNPLWHLRMFTAPINDPATSTLATAAGYGTGGLADLGKDATVFLNDGPYLNGSYFTNAQPVRSLAMHEAGHAVLGLPHENSPANVMESGIASHYGQLNVLPGHQTTINGRFGAAKSKATLYAGHVGTITLAYTSLLYRMPDASGFKFYLDALQAGTKTFDSMCADLAASPEYAGVHAGETDYNFAYTQYSRVLGRIGSNAELNYWAGQVATNGRLWVAKSIMGTAEARTSLLTRWPNGWWAV